MNEVDIRTFIWHVLVSVEEWSTLENGTNVSVMTTYPLVNATNLRQNPLYAKNVVFILNLLTMGKIQLFTDACCVQIKII